MTRATFSLTYGGQDVDDHGMDVAELAPALLALGDLLKAANVLVNGEKSDVTLRVMADFEHKCFNVNLELVQSIYEAIKSLIVMDGVKTAKELLEWVGLFGGTKTLLAFLRRRNGRDYTLITQNPDGTTTVKIEGDAAPIVINTTIYNAAKDPKIVSAAREVLAPLEKDGISSVSFGEGDGARPSVTYHRDDLDAIIATEGAVERETGAVGPVQSVEAVIQVHTATLDLKAKSWKFKYGPHVVKVDISESGIAEDVFKRGVIGIGDAYKVKMDIVQRSTPSGLFRLDYKATKILQFIPVARQRDLWRSDDGGARSR